MDIDALGEPADLWRRWTLLAAATAAADQPTAAGDCSIQGDDGIAFLRGEDGSWLRLRRSVGNRAVLWGHDPGVMHSEEYEDDLRDSVPDWAMNRTELAVWGPRGIRWCAWFGHGWTALPARPPAGIGVLLERVGDDDRVIDTVRSLGAEIGTTAAPGPIFELLASPTLELAREVFGPRGAVPASKQIEVSRTWLHYRLTSEARAYLLDQIRAQMRDAGELLDRGHPKRPKLLRQWLKVNRGDTPFRLTVSSVFNASQLTPGAGGSGLTEPSQRSLVNVLRELRAAETDPETGAWLFAKVEYDGQQARLVRRYDSWPAWYASEEPMANPSIPPLMSEMTRRVSRARPGWSHLLPSSLETE